MDQQEFADRTEAIKTRLYRTAYLYLGSEADALEAVDETVYRALWKLKQLQTPALFETWITRILMNTCHQELRRRKRFARTGEEALPEDAGFEAAFSSMSGEFRSDFPVSGDRGPSGRALYGDGRCKLEFATTSGSMVVARG